MIEDDSQLWDDLDAYLKSLERNELDRWRQPGGGLRIPGGYWIKQTRWGWVTGGAN